MNRDDSRPATMQSAKRDEKEPDTLTQPATMQSAKRDEKEPDNQLRPEGRL